MWWPPLLVLSERGAHAVAAWLQGGLGLSADDVCKMVKRNPAILSCSIVHNLRPKFGYAVEREELYLYGRHYFYVLPTMCIR